MSHVPPAPRGWATGTEGAPGPVAGPGLSSAVPVHGSDALRAANEKTRELRLRQADHLTEVANQNSNERLGQTADRLRDHAQQQYETAVIRAQAAPISETEQPELGTAPATARMPATPARSWRDRIHFARPFGR